MFAKVISACQELLRAYAQVLLSRSCWSGFAILVATLVAPRAFLFGLVAVVVSSLVARVWKVDRGVVGEGLYGYNALLVGLGIGQTFTGFAIALPMTMVAATMTVVVTAALKSWLGRTSQVPVLSLPFLLVFALSSLMAPHLGLAHGRVAVDDGAFSALVPTLASDFLRDLGALFFVPSVEAGCLILLALLIYSRIATMLALAAYGLVLALGAAFSGLVDAHTLQAITCNGMLAAVAIGGVWFVPSLAALAWGMGAVALCALITLGISTPFASLGLGPLFVPFNLTAYCVLLAARERTRDHAPKSVDFIPGTPEENLAYFRTRLARFQTSYGLRFRLPCRGWWTCTQSVNGEHTHQGRWRHAFDFEVMGHDGRSFRGDGRAVEDYHCYRLPVLATASGTVVKVVDVVPDNAVGDVNVKQNWGNLVMVLHGPSLFALVAHLAPGSCKVREGQTIHRGDVLGLCGNSGRSPVPHLHFQLQGTATLGADTLPCAFNDAVTTSRGEDRLTIAMAPEKNAVVRNLEPGDELRAHFNVHDGDAWVYQVGDSVEQVVCDMDVLGQLTLKSAQRSAFIVFERTEDCFTCFDVVGDRQSVLHLLRAALPRLPFEENPRMVWRDFVPIRSLFVLGGLEVEYTMTRQGRRWVITGNALRRDGQGEPILRTLADIEDGAGPLAIEVIWRGHARTATRLLGDDVEPRHENQVPRKNHENNAHLVAGRDLPTAPSVFALRRGGGGAPERGSLPVSRVL